MEETDEDKILHLYNQDFEIWVFIQQHSKMYTSIYWSSVIFCECARSKVVKEQNNSSPLTKHQRFYCTKEKWEEIIEKFDKNKFLPWVWPEKENLEFIGKCVRSQNLKSLISVGCGSGLLEWLLASATGLEVIGIEIDGNWWKSKYSSGTFIPMVLTENSTKGELRMETRDSALLFCYFNNLKAFLNYVDNFKGSCLIVIGPGRGRGTYTIPEPFDLPNGLEKSWKLSDHQEVRSSKDFIAVYARK